MLLQVNPNRRRRIVRRDRDWQRRIDQELNKFGRALRMACHPLRPAARPQQLLVEARRTPSGMSSRSARTTLTPRMRLRSGDSAPKGVEPLQALGPMLGCLKTRTSRPGTSYIWVLSPSGKSTALASILQKPKSP